MKTYSFLPTAFVLMLFPFVLFGNDFGKSYQLEILPSEMQKTTDPLTGVELTYLTSKTPTRNLYFHERSFASDGSFITFNATGTPAGAMVYLSSTSELAYVKSPDGTILRNHTCAKFRPSIYGFSNNKIVEIALEVKRVKNKTELWARERVLADAPTLGAVSLNESCDGRYLSAGGSDPLKPGMTAVFTVDTHSGEVKRVCGMPEDIKFGVSHIQWSISNPNLLSFANNPIRLWIVDIRDGKMWAPYIEHTGELVTHEKWWVNDQMLFCGSYHAKPQEDGHVKLLDVHSGDCRVIGAGAWWPSATPEELAKRNWWHCSGSDDGMWVVADNWHGDIMLWEGKTSRPRLLTEGHRTYGKGTHPEVGFDNRGTQLIFASHKLGNGVFVCVARIPDEWNRENREYGKRIESLKESGGMVKKLSEVEVK